MIKSEDAVVGLMSPVVSTCTPYSVSIPQTFVIATLGRYRTVWRGCSTGANPQVPPVEVALGRQGMPRRPVAAPAGTDDSAAGAQRYCPVPTRSIARPPRSSPPWPTSVRM